jgi:hypothetical protein
MGQWFKENYVEFPAMPGLIKLIESLWFQREYLDGKRLYYGPNGLNRPESLRGYEKGKGEVIGKLENRIKRILKETELIHPRSGTTRQVYWDTRFRSHDDLDED